MYQASKQWRMNAIEDNRHNIEANLSAIHGAAASMLLKSSGMTSYLSMLSVYLIVFIIGGLIWTINFRRCSLEFSTLLVTVNRLLADYVQSWFVLYALMPYNNVL